MNILYLNYFRHRCLVCMSSRSQKNLNRRHIQQILILPQYIQSEIFLRYRTKIRVETNTNFYDIQRNPMMSKTDILSNIKYFQSI